MMPATFFLDTFVLLPIFAFLIAALAFAAPFRLQRLCLSVLFWLTIMGFWLIAGGLYFNLLQISDLPLIGGWFTQFGDPNNFMWNFENNCWHWASNETLAFWKWQHQLPAVSNPPSYLCHWSPRNLIGIAWLFAGYPITLWSWIQIRFLLLGRSSKQVGILGNF